MNTISNAFHFIEGARDSRYFSALVTLNYYVFHA